MTRRRHRQDDTGSDTEGDCLLPFHRENLKGILDRSAHSLQCRYSEDSIQRLQNRHRTRREPQRKTLRRSLREAPRIAHRGKVQTVISVPMRHDHPVDRRQATVFLQRPHGTRPGIHDKTHTRRPHQVGRTTPRLGRQSRHTQPASKTVRCIAPTEQHQRVRRIRHNTNFRTLLTTRGNISMNDSRPQRSTPSSTYAPVPGPRPHLWRRSTPHFSTSGGTGGSMTLHVGHENESGDHAQLNLPRRRSQVPVREPIEPV